MIKKVKLDSLKKSLPVHVHSLSHDGRGIASIEGKTTFINGALPNEKVAYKITQKRSHYNDAETLEVIEPSAERVTPPCQHFGLCGGCSLQHMSIYTQSLLKQNTLLDQLKHFGNVAPLAILPPLQTLAIGYRRKARLGVKFVIKKNKMLVGFREKSSRYLADLERCAVLHPLVGEKLMVLAQLIMTLESYNQIPQIEVAMGDEKAALVFRHMESLSAHDKEKLIAFGQAHQFHIYLQPNSPMTVTKLWPVNGQDRLAYTLPDFELEFLFHPLDFTQINLEMNRLMVKQAIDLLDLQPTDHVLDLFSGIGNFTLPIARYAKFVTGVEGGNEMVLRAEDNAHHNRIGNVDFYAANLENPSSSAPWMKIAYDKLLLDPPRAGAKDILPYLPQLNPKKIVYVSCNPATLARDAGEIVHRYGYQLNQAGIMNMFPHTSHIEAMAIFDRIKI